MLLSVIVSRVPSVAIRTPEVFLTISMSRAASVSSSPKRTRSAVSRCFSSSAIRPSLNTCLQSSINCALRSLRNSNSLFSRSTILFVTVFVFITRWSYVVVLCDSFVVTFKPPIMAASPPIFTPVFSLCGDSTNLAPHSIQYFPWKSTGYSFLQFGQYIYIRI